jgi:DNA-binding beta-propeller fold protein YncE
MARIDPGTGAPLAVVPLPGRPATVVTAANSLFVTSPIQNEVWQIDPITGAVSARVRTGNGALGAAVGEATLWVTNELDGTISAISLVTG